MGVSFTQTATKSVRALGTRMIVGQKKDVDYPDELGAQGISNPVSKCIVYVSVIQVDAFF